MNFRVLARLRTLGLLVVAAVAGWVVPSAAMAADPVEFDYTGGTQTYVVPSGVTNIQADVQGADGGGVGGPGAQLLAVVPVTPGQTLTIYVGGKGTASAGGWPNGGDPGASPDSRNKGSGGGAASEIRRGSTRLAVAGGGGGGGRNGAGGHGSLVGLPGQPVHGWVLPEGSLFMPQGGLGGTPVSGGLGGDADNGYGDPGESGTWQYGGKGGDAWDTDARSGGGGGGGYYGGGGGGSRRDDLSGSTLGTPGSGGGGGGSSFVAPGVVPVAVFVNLGQVNGKVIITPVDDPSGGNCAPGQVGKPPACVNPNPGSCPQGQTGTPPACVPTPGSGQFSNSCQDGDAKVADGFSGSVYVSLRVQQNPENAQETWACYRAWNATGSVDVGGRVDFDQSGGTPGIPDIEPDSSGCSVTPVDLKVGPDETPVLVGVNSTPSEAQACFQVATFEQRVRVPVPGGVGGVPQVNQDDPTVPDPEERQGNPAHPSSTCQNTPGNTRLANLESGSTWIAAYSAPGGPSETRLCVRGQGPASAGGMLTVRSTTGVAPVVEGPVADTAPSSSCASNVLANGSDPAKFSIRVTATNPASLCLSVGSSGQFGAPGQRFTLGTSGSPVVPVAWTPDPGTPG